MFSNKPIHHLNDVICEMIFVNFTFSIFGDEVCSPSLFTYQFLFYLSVLLRRLEYYSRQVLFFILVYIESYIPSGNTQLAFTTGSTRTLVNSKWNVSNTNYYSSILEVIRLLSVYTIKNTCGSISGCCVCWPAFRCYAHPKAGQNSFWPCQTFFSFILRFSSFFIIFLPRKRKNIQKSVFLGGGPKTKFLRLIRQTR